MLVVVSWAQWVMCAPAATQPSVLRIAADPNNLPFSNEKLEGFENKIAALIGGDLGMPIQYTWWAQRRGFFRDTVRHGDNEIVMGVPSQGFERMVPSRPYYRSTYVFVYRADKGLDVSSFDDAILRKVKIGVPLVGGMNNSPPAQALGERGIVDNIRGYSLFNDYRQANPASEILRDVVKGEIDVAIVWGPFGGYFAKHETEVPLKVVPVKSAGRASTPFAYSISVGVKRGHGELKQRVDEVLARHQGEIDRILDEYGVPRLPLDGEEKTAERSSAEVISK